jgi:hypothetical protein
MAKMPRNYPPVPTKLVPSGGAGGGATTGTTAGEPYYPPVPGQGTNPGNGGGTSAPTAGLGFNRQDFIKNYANMVARTWTDDSYLQLLLADPVDTLNAAGLPTIPGAVVRVVQHQITGTGRIEDEVSAWVAGNQTGLYDLFLPIKPDYIDFSGAGGSPDSESGGGSCCCSPCCCCT